MTILLIASCVFMGVYSLAYQIYLYRKMHLSLGIMKEGEAAASQMKVESGKEGLLRSVLRPFAFLGRIRAARTLASRAVPSRLVMAGHPISIVEFIIFKVVSMFAFAVSSVIAFGKAEAMFMAPALAIGFIVPDIWLNIKIKRRHFEIRRDLPAVIDLLNLCVNAGLDFMLAVNRVVKDFKKCPLNDELAEVWRETRMGASRREALQHLSRRVNLVELSSFVRTLLQADRMGSPMGEALKIQSEEIRMRRYFQGEEMALKAPVKLLLPLIFFILPAVLVIVAGPVFLQFMRGGLKF